MGVDLFTTVLRYVIAVVLTWVFVIALGVWIWNGYMSWKLKHHHRVYDWMRDGECGRDEWEQGSHVNVLDRVPEDWSREMDLTAYRVAAEALYEWETNGVEGLPAFGELTNKSRYYEGAMHILGSVEVAIG